MRAVSLHEYVVKRLLASKGTWRVVAEDSGVSRRTLEKIARGEVKDPGVLTVQKLADYFRSTKP
jgi:transcriptional regulator with XRE-family HTH domain